MKGEVLIPCLLTGAVLLVFIVRSFPRESIFSLAALMLPLTGVVDSKAIFRALMNPWMFGLVALFFIEKKCSRPFFHREPIDFPRSFPFAPLLDLFSAYLFFSGMTNTSWATTVAPASLVYAIPFFLALGRVIGKWFPVTILFSLYFATVF